MIYLFTNHKNLLLAAIKGYLVPFGYWNRAITDVADEHKEILSKHLVFGNHPLPYEFSYQLEKSLHGVALGVDEEVLEQLDYVKDGEYYKGTTPILFSLISEIVFETSVGRTLLEKRYEDYYAMIGNDRILVKESLFQSSKSEFCTDHPIVEDITTSEQRLNRSFGALGHLIEELTNYHSLELLLATHLLQTHYETKTQPIDYSALINFAELLYPDWVLTEPDVRLLDVLIDYGMVGISEESDDLIERDEYTVESILRFLACHDRVLNRIESDIKGMDRKPYLEMLQECYAKSSNPDGIISDLLDKILKVYDYRYDFEELYRDIDDQSDEVLRRFLLGLVLFLRDPVDTKNIENLKHEIGGRKTTAADAVALFLWGRTHGAFFLDPGKKLQMLKAYGIGNFNALCVSDYPRDLIGFDVDQLKSSSSDKSFGHYNGYEFWQEEGPVVDSKDCRSHVYSIRSSTSLKLEYTVRDYFEDVNEFLQNLFKGNETLSPTELAWMLENCIPQSVKFSVGNFTKNLEVLWFNPSSLSLELKSIQSNRETTPLPAVIVQVDSLEFWNDLIHSELEGRNLPIVMKSEIRQELLTGRRKKPGYQDGEEKPDKGIGDPNLKEDDSARDLNRFPTMRDKKEYIVAWCEAHKIPHTDKEKKQSLLEKIKQHYEPDLGLRYDK